MMSVRRAGYRGYEFRCWPLSGRAMSEMGQTRSSGRRRNISA